MALVILIVYGIALLFIFLFSINQWLLAILYTSKKDSSQPKSDVEITEWPMVTIQLPIYNEKYVVERLIKCMGRFDYPHNKLEIQLLDDSDDNTTEVIQSALRSGFHGSHLIQHIRRKKRIGFKAGALGYGLTMAKGDFIAIFDADFVPEKDFLKKVIPKFTNDEIGMVQTRWGHLNRGFSILTRLQAFGLDAHFSVEQGGRNAGGHFINFNGTAGVWRKKTILDSGGWQADTLTEDLDLSYRAQLNGWKCIYFENCVAPAELPAEMNALKTQQYRWTKGAAECTRKNLLKLLRSNQFETGTKVNGFFHLLNSSVFICIVLTSVLSIPVLYIKQAFPEYSVLYNLAGIFLLGVLGLSWFYFVSYSKNKPIKILALPGFLVHFPIFLSVSMGLSLHNGIAALEGLLGKKTPFLRTPKLNITDCNGSWRDNHYVSKTIGKLTVIELLLSLYFGFGVWLSFYWNDFGLMPFLIMLSFGFGFVSTLSIKHALS